MLEHDLFRKPVSTFRDHALAEAHATAARESDLNQAVALTRTDLDRAVALLDQKIARLDQKIDTQTLRLTVRLGVLMAAGIAVLGAIVKLT